MLPKLTVVKPNKFNKVTMRKSRHTLKKKHTVVNRLYVLQIANLMGLITISAQIKIALTEYNKRSL